MTLPPSLTAFPAQAGTHLSTHSLHHGSRFSPGMRVFAMPKRTDIESILIIGAGPIVIGQACEFDYSGAQACKALKDEGYRIVLVNSNPATIMTDPELADATYIEPITPDDGRADHRRASGPTRCCRRWAARPRSTPRWRWPRSGVLAAPRGRADRRQRGGDRQGRGPPAVPRGDGPDRPRIRRRAGSSASLDEAIAGARRRSACRRSSGRPSPWAAPAAASPTTPRNSRRSSAAACAPRRRTRC